MTDKERIIIDGVDVQNCLFISTNGLSNHKIPYCREFTNNCKDNPNCYFKQLDRETQECEELKEKYKWYDHYKDSALLNKKLCDKASDERDRYRKALEEIERLANENNELLQGYHHEWANNKLILEIISKAKGEGE